MGLGSTRPVVALLLLFSAAEGQTFQLAVDRVEAIPGSSVEVVVHLDNTEPVSGFEVCLKFPSTFLQLEEITLRDTMLADAVLEDFRPTIANARDLGAADVVLSSEAPFPSTIATGEDQVVLRFVFSVEEGILPDTHLALTLQDSPYGTNQVFVRGSAVDVALSDGGVDVGTENLLIASDASGIPGEREVPVELMGFHSGPLYGFSIALAFDRSLLRAAGAGFEGTITETVGAEFTFADIDNSWGTCVLGVLVDSKMPLTGNHIPVTGFRVVLARVLFDVLPDATPGSVSPLDLADGVGFPPADNVFVMGKQESVAPVVLDGSFTVLARAVFVRGDVITNGTINLADVVAILSNVFGRYPIDCLKAADVDDDGKVALADAIHALNFIFRHGKAIASPWPDPGTDPTEDNLPCLAPIP